MMEEPPLLRQVADRVEKFGVIRWRASDSAHFKTLVVERFVIWEPIRALKSPTKSFGSSGNLWNSSERERRRSKTEASSAACGA